MVSVHMSICNNHVSSINTSCFNSYQVSQADNDNDNDNEASLDYQGNPADKSKTGGWLAAGLILGTLINFLCCYLKNGLILGTRTYQVLILK